jgi:hypothetical protein
LSAFLLNDKLGFLTEGNLAAIFIIPSSWGSQLAGYLLHQPGSIKLFFWRRCRGRVEDLCKGSFSHTHPLLYYYFALLYLFYLHHFISKTQKN